LKSIHAEPEINIPVLFKEESFIEPSINSTSNPFNLAKFINFVELVLLKNSPCDNEIEIFLFKLLLKIFFVKILLSK